MMNACPAAYDVPIAMFVFNRPDLTEEVFLKVAEARPETLLVVADGPRAGRSGEAERVAAVRAIFERVDWPCRVITHYSEANMGCRDRVSSGIDWVFSQVERAVILEDDCLPSPSFFAYCRDMLDLYQDDKRVFAISGTNFADAGGDPGHYYSRFSLMWGWATWRDRWQYYRVSPTDVSAVVDRTWPGQPKRQLFWKKTISRADQPGYSTWDWQWILTLWRHDALAVRPTRNLIRNIGFGVDATHTHSPEAAAAKLPVFETVASFRNAPRDVAPDLRRDAADERLWAGINWKTVVALHAPWMVRLRNMLR